MTERRIRRRGWIGVAAIAAVALLFLAADHGGPAGNRAVGQQPLQGRQLQPRIQIIQRNGRIVQLGRRLPARAGDASEFEGIDGVFLPMDRDTARQLDKAKQLLDEARYSDASTLLDDILKRGEDYFFKPESGEPTHRSMKAEAQRLIGEMPLEGLKAYQLQFGARAQQMLSAAAAEGDVAKLEEVARRFFHTKAGYQATLLLGRRHLDHAQPLAAALCFQRLLDTPQAAATFDPALSVMTAVSWLRGGMSQRAGEVLVALKKKNPKASVQIGAARAPRFSDRRSAVAWLNSALGKPRDGKPAGEVEQWAMHRGNPSRNAVSAGGMPLLNPQWRVSTTNHPTLEKSLVDLRKLFTEQGVPALPVVQPLAVGDLVLMRTPRELLAIDFVTGKRLWPVRTGEASWDLQQSAMSPFGQVTFGALANPTLTERIWADATQGTIASDGRRVYLVQDALDRSDRRDALQQRLSVELPRPYNKLSACELRTQGKLKWEVGGDDGEDEPQLAGAFFLGPPLPLQGKLYVLAEINGEIKLCVLNSQTGRMEWSQQLAIVEQTVYQDPFRNLAGCTPSFADGVLVCPTSAGAVVAVDLTNRSLLWGFQYPRSLLAAPNLGMLRGNLVIEGQMMPYASIERCKDSAAVVADGRVVVSPPDSDDLHCLSLIEGTPLWKQDRGDYLYVGGVQHGNVLLVGKRNAIALRSADGKPAWDQVFELPDSAMPSGRGFLSDGEYYLPLTTAEVIRIDVADGRITGRAKSRKGNVPGNLICHRGEIISLGIDYLETFYQLEPLKDRIAEALNKNPDDAWALAHRGEIALEEGRLAQAVSDVRRAYKAEATPLARDLFVEVLLTALDRDFSEYEDAVAELEPLVRLDQERARFLRVVAAGWQKQRQISRALEAYSQLAELPPADEDELDELAADYSVRREQWLRANVNELIAMAGPKDRAAIDAAIEQRLDAAVAEKGVKPLRQFLSYFGDHPAAERARELLAEQAGGPSALLEREQLLRRLEESSDTARRKTALVKLAALLRDAGQENAALAYYRRMADEFGDQPILDGKTIAQWLDELPQDSPLGKVQRRSPHWPEGEIVAKRNTRSTRNMPYSPASLSIELRGPRGPFFDDVTIGWHASGNEIIGRDGVGNERFRLSLTDGGRINQPVAIRPAHTYAAVHNHLLVLCTGMQVFGIDTLRSSEGAGGRVLWRYDIGDPNGNVVYASPNAVFPGRRWVGQRAVRPEMNVPQGSLGPVTANGVCLQRGNDVMSLDPFSGKILWTRRVDWPNAELFGDEEIIIVAPPDGRERNAQVLRAIDGRLLGDCPAPVAQQRWTTYGRCVLAWNDLPNGKQQLQLLDPWAKREVWSATFAGGVKGTIVDDESVAVMQPDGRFAVLSIAKGRTTIDELLEPEPKLEDLYVMRSAEQDILVTNRPMANTRASSDGRRNVQGPIDGASPLITGRIYAFDRASGKPQWAAPASVEEQGLVLSQPPDLPVLIFLRVVTTTGSRGPTQSGSLLCIDKRTGRLVYEDASLPQQISNFEAVGDLEEKTVTMNMLQQTVTLKFTNTPVPPEPPYQAGLVDASPRRGPAATLLRALRMATESEVMPVKVNDDPFE